MYVRARVLSAKLKGDEVSTLRYCIKATVSPPRKVKREFSLVVFAAVVLADVIVETTQTRSAKKGGCFGRQRNEGEKKTEEKGYLN